MQTRHQKRNEHRIHRDAERRRQKRRQKIGRDRADKRSEITRQIGDERHAEKDQSRVLCALLDGMDGKDLVGHAERQKHLKRTLFPFQVVHDTGRHDKIAQVQDERCQQDRCNASTLRIHADRHHLAGTRMDKCGHQARLKHGKARLTRNQRIGDAGRDITENDGCAEMHSETKCGKAACFLLTHSACTFSASNGGSTFCRNTASSQRPNLKPDL